MRIENILAGASRNRHPASVDSIHPDVQELLTKFNGNRDVDCAALDGGELAFVGAIYNEVLDDPLYIPTFHILSLIRDLNSRMRAVG